MKMEVSEQCLPLTWIPWGGRGRTRPGRRRRFCSWRATFPSQRFTECHQWDISTDWRSSWLRLIRISHWSIWSDTSLSLVNLGMLVTWYVCPLDWYYVSCKSEAVVISTQQREYRHTCGLYTEAVRLEIILTLQREYRENHTINYHDSRSSK